MRIPGISLWKCLPVVLAACLAGASSCNERPARPADPKTDKLKLPDGFIAEHLFSPSDSGRGSWVAMTFDDKGRLIVSDQFGALYRLKLPPIGADSTQQVSIEPLGFGKDTIPGTDSVRTKVTMGFAQGLLYAFNSLYVMVNHSANDQFDKGSGLYRLQDTDNDDQFDKVTLLKAMEGSGEHGPHSIILSPDGQSIYLIAGNHTKCPEMDAYMLPSNWQEDNLIPRMVDPNGHAVNIKPPGGWIAKIDPEGKHWELVSAGYRNPFDIAFNDAGDLFTYDSDMEWDFGLPWYRPTRICHATGGSDFGWRTGTMKWSPTYPDNLPPVINIGQGSPTNLVYGGNARFPEKYRKSMFAFDWSFGIVYALQLEPNGGSYKATGEEFLSGSPLPLTDGVIGPDGALYFLTGGRKLESDLYRVYHENAGDYSNKLQPAKLTEENSLRRQLEKYHHGPDPAAVDFAWPQLKHPDRFVRYAARIALEHQPVVHWQGKVFAETDPVALIHGALSLARMGDSSLRDSLLHKLATIDFGKLSPESQIDAVRAAEVTIARMGMPDDASKVMLAAWLQPFYPAKTNEMNRLLSKLLVHIGAPDAVRITVELMASAKDDTSAGQSLLSSSDLIMRNPQYGMAIAGMLAKMPPAQQTFYATVLSGAKNGWTDPLRQAYFKWYAGAFGYQGGNSFVGYINNARKNALALAPKEQFAQLNDISGDSIVKAGGNFSVASGVQPKGPGRNWKVDDAVKMVDSIGFSASNFEQGKAMFSATLCSKCHTLAGQGGVAGPDLTQLGTRFSNKDILESIIDPNKTISDQYGATVFYLKDGGSVIGRLTNEDDEQYFVSQNPFSPQDIRKVPKKSVSKTRVSEVSPMLPGMINRLSPQELVDLMAYLKSGGNPKDTIFTNSKRAAVR